MRNGLKSNDFLSEREPLLRPWIKKLGPIKFRVPRTGPQAELYPALLRAIAHQQLHAKAAATILGRFYSLYGGVEIPNPKLVVKTSIEKLRGVGFSQNKALAILDIARHRLEGKIPLRAQSEKISDQALIEMLTQIRGVGPWTVQMLLIFTLGRKDVWPTSDFGVQKGAQIAFALRSMPNPKRLAVLGEPLSPHRTTAALLMWKIADFKNTSSRAQADQS